MGNTNSIEGYSRLHHGFDPLLLSGKCHESMEVQQLDNKANRERNISLKKAIKELKSNMIRLGKEMQANISKALTPHPSKEEKAYTSLEKEVNELKLRFAKLETAISMFYSMKKQEEATKELNKKITALEKKVEELTAIVTEMKRRKSAPVISRRISNHIPELIDFCPEYILNNIPTVDDASTTTTAPSGGFDLRNPTMVNITSTEPAQQLEMNKHPVDVDHLIGCLVILIFLMAVLIGRLL